MNLKNLKIKLKTLFVASVTTCVCVFGFVSCGDEADEKGTVYNPSQPVVLTSFKPDSGRISERVLLDGSNFGTDASKIKVFFNAKEAKVINSTGTRILALVPRLPGDTCEVSVEINGKKVSYSDFFRYKIEATVTTFTGNGNDAEVFGKLDQAQLKPHYLGIDADKNIFATSLSYIVKINEEEDEVIPLAGPNGALVRLQMNATPDNVIMLGYEGAGSRDFFYAMDPNEGWIPKTRYIKKWTLNGFILPGNNPGYPYGSGLHENAETHHHCLWCYADDHLYTRYNDGHIVKINPKTWEAEIIYRTVPGVAYGMAFHPSRPTELWIIYENGYGGSLSNVVCTFDVTDTTSFSTLSRSGDVGHRDGPLVNALFNCVRQINFDSDGNLYIGDCRNHCIRKIDTETMMVGTIIGIPEVSGFNDGAKEEARFDNPHGIVTDVDGIVYVCDTENRRIRRIAIE
jgi:outer membrane protein assembly factor BamB